MKILRSNTSEAYKVQVDCLKNSKSDSYDKNDVQEKVSDLVRLHETLQEELKTASYSEQIQILTCTVENILVSLNTFFELHMKSKSRWNISKTCS